jgi:Domain of unknown function (DUF5655)/Domain of unknown function (DUF4287)
MKMDNLQKARATQLHNIEAKTGKNLDAIRQIIEKSGLKKHGEIRSMLMQELGLSHGDANAVVHFALETDGQTAAEAKGLSDDAVIDEIYAGKKAGLRPLHETIMDFINALGDFDIAPKKGYISLRRKKQFVMLGPATNDVIEIGLNTKENLPTDRLKAQPPNSMCQYKLRLSQASELDAEVKSWVTIAFEGAG